MERAFFSDSWFEKGMRVATLSALKTRPRSLREK